MSKMNFNLKNLDKSSECILNPIQLSIILRNENINYKVQWAMQ